MRRHQTNDMPECSKVWDILFLMQIIHQICQLVSMAYNKWEKTKERKWKQMWKRNHKKKENVKPKEDEEKEEHNK